MLKDTTMRFFKGDKTNQGDVNWNLNVGQKEERITFPEAPKEMSADLSKTDKELKEAYESTRDFVARIDAEFVRQGNRYVFKSYERKESWEVSFVENARKTLKRIEWIQQYIKQKEEFNRKKQAKIDEAWKNYNKLRDIWKDQNPELVKPSYYEYGLNTMGWLNIDKFHSQPLANYTGKIMDKNGKKVNYSRVHLVSMEEKIHLQKVSDTGEYSFDFPLGKTFKIMVFRGSKKSEIEITNASSAQIPDIVI